MVVVRRFSCNFKRFQGRVVLVSALFLTLLFLLWDLSSTDGGENGTRGNERSDETGNTDNIDIPIILWWTPFTKQTGRTRNCGGCHCFFTEDRKFFSHEQLYTIVFYGSELNFSDLPLPRREQHDWALLHEESPKNGFHFCIPSVMRWFNHTATFARGSDLPLTLQYLRGIEDLTGGKYFRTTDEKNWARDNQHLAPVAYVQSDCDTPVGRDAYVLELAKHVRVDSYGKCLHNKDLPPELSDAMRAMDDERFWHLLARYKFHLAIENSRCEDYITEKLWRPLIVGSVPVYAGSPSVADWLPNGLRSAMLVSDFSSPRRLAEALKEIERNDSAYERFLDHKNGVVSNDGLKRALSLREWGVDGEPEKPNFVEAFECLVCRRAWKKIRKEDVTFVADGKHYFCESPKSLLTGREDPKSWWRDAFYRAGSEAKVLDYFLSRNEPFNRSDFENKLAETLRADEAKHRS